MSFVTKMSLRTNTIMEMWMDTTFAARKDHRFPTVVTVAAIFGMGCFLGVSGAQGVEEIDFDRPESWAMKYFASVHPDPDGDSGSPGAVDYRYGP